MDGAAADELLIEPIPVGPMHHFVYVVGSRATREVALVDPAWQIDALLAHLDEREPSCSAVLVTHDHPDHVGGSLFGMQIEGLAALLERRSARLYVHREEAFGIQRVTGLSAADLVPVDSGERIALGGIELEFPHTPGHTPGGQCFCAGRHPISGDTWFVRGCGRVDLPGADPDPMFRSLQPLAALPGDTVLWPGHPRGPEPSATLGSAKRANPYLQARDRAAWHRLLGRGAVRPRSARAAQLRPAERRAAATPDVCVVLRRLRAAAPLA